MPSASESLRSRWAKPCAQHASASPITLGSPANYGPFVGAKDTLTLAGGLSLSGNAAVGANSTVNLSGAKNIEGTGSTVSLTSSGAVVGTILAPQRNVTLSGGGTLTGALVAGFNNGSANYTAQTSTGGYNITSLGYVPRVSTPEPSSIALFGAGVSALIAARRRRRI